jgi:alcohol oxidase
MSSVTAHSPPTQSPSSAITRVLTRIRRFGAGDPNTVPADQYISVSVFNVHPYSRGHMHITGPNVGDPVDFATGFFSDPLNLDVKMHIWAYKVQREMVRRMENYRGEVAAYHPPFPADSAAACTTSKLDGSLENVKNIEYTPEDDALLEKWLRKHIGTTWHSIGTAKMAPREKNGAVDATLSVHGVQGLKVADLSIVPENVSANTNSTALAVGEKAADILIEELGLRK